MFYRSQFGIHRRLRVFQNIQGPNYFVSKFVVCVPNLSHTWQVPAVLETFLWKFLLLFLFKMFEIFFNFFSVVGNAHCFTLTEQYSKTIWQKTARMQKMMDRAKKQKHIALSEKVETWLSLTKIYCIIKLWKE